MNDLAGTVADGYRVIAESYHRARLAKEDVNIEWLGSLSHFLPASGSVVDLGCGTGVPITRYFASRGYSVTGYDLSDAMLEIARREVPQATFHRIAGEDMRLDSATVDLVLSFFAIIHIDRQLHGELFARIFDWLRPGGVVLLSLGAEDNPRERQEDWYGAEMLWSHFGAETNLGLLRAAGFEIVWHEVEDFGGEKHLFVIAGKPVGD